MGLISVTPVVDGATATAASINNQISTIVNEFNGNVTDANVAAGAAIALTKLAISVSTQANAGTAGGTMYYINLGGIKMLWCNADSKSAGYYTFTLPTSFFSTLQLVIPGNGVVLNGTVQYCVLMSANTTTVTVAVNGPGTIQCELLIIGT